MTTESRVTRLYRRCCRNCRTVNQLSKVHIAFENRITPGEAEALHRELMATPRWNSRIAFWPTRTMALARGRFPRLLRAIGRRAEQALHQRRWIRRLHGMRTRGAEAAPAEMFTRARLGHHLVLYRGAGERSSKTLVIAFTGSSARLMLPMPVFLQQLVADEVDLVLVRYPQGRGFFRGLLPPPGDRFEDAVDRIATLARRDRYARVVALGMSGGALPALMAARRLGLDGAVAVGSTGPDDARWQRALGHAAGDVLRGDTGEADAAPLRGVWLLVGADHPRDREAAAALAAIIPSARIVEVTDAAGLVGHNPFIPLLRRGELRALLARTLLDASR